MISTKQIHDICDQYKIENYTINPDGSIDVDGDVDGNVYLDSLNLEKLPLKFNYVSGYFSIYNNCITSLEGCPKEVGESFDCAKNQITSLKYSPIKVGSYMNIYMNPLESLEGYNFKSTLYCDDLHKLTRKTKLKNIINDELD